MRIGLYRACVLAGLVGLALSGCAGRTVVTDVYQDAAFTVRLRHALDEDRNPVDRGYGHPLSISPEEAGSILQSMRVKYRGGLLQSIVEGKRPAVTEAFSEEEVERMADGIAAAFGRATPADQVEFQFKHRRGVFSAGTTTGVLYVMDERMEILLGNYKASPIPKGGGPEPGFGDPLESIGTGRFEIVPEPYQELHPGDDLVPEGHGLVLNYRALLESGPGPVPSLGKADAGGGKAEPGIEEKLETLDRLLEKGLISQEEYDQKRKSILEAF